MLKFSIVLLLMLLNVDVKRSLAIDSKSSTLSENAQSVDNDNRCKIALLLPTEKNHAQIAQHMLYGSLFAVTNLNYKSDCKVTAYYIPTLTNSDWHKEPEVKRFLSNNDNIVIGPMYPTAAHKLYQVVKSKKKMISLLDFGDKFYADNPDIINFSIDKTQQLATVFRYMKNYNRKFISFILPSNAQSYALQKQINKIAKKYDIFVVAIEFYQENNQKSIDNAVSKIYQMRDVSYMVNQHGDIITEDYRETQKNKKNPIFADANLDVAKSRIDSIFISATENDLNTAISNFKSHKLFDNDIFFFSNAQMDLNNSVYADSYLEHFYFVGYDYHYIHKFNKVFKDIFEYYPNFSVYIVYDILSTLLYLNNEGKFDLKYGINLAGDFHGILDDFEVFNNGKINRRFKIYKIKNSIIDAVY